MIRADGYNDHTPTRALMSAVRSLAPTLANADDPDRADLTIRPRRTDIRHGDTAVTPGAWYDLYWTYPAVEQVYDPALDADVVKVQHVPIRHVGTLGAPPLIPVEERLAAAPPPSLGELSGPEIAILGGPDAARRLLAARQRIAVEHDHSTGAYDWEALAQQVVAIARSQAPALTAEQRARADAARRLQAERTPAGANRRA